MYRSLMFRSNPLNEQFHRDDNKAIKPLQIKNYSFTKISQKRRDISTPKNKPFLSKGRYLIQTLKQKQKSKQKNQFSIKKYNTIKLKSPNQNPQHQLKNIFQDVDKKKQGNKLLFTSKQQRSLKSMFGDYTPKKKVIPQQKITLQDKSLFQHKRTDQVNFNSKLQQKNFMIQSIDQSVNQNLLKNKKNVHQRLTHEKKSERKLSLNQDNLEVDRKVQSQQNNLLKSVIYQSIDLDNLFQKIQRKVSNSSKQKGNDEFSPLKRSIIQKLKKQANTPNLKTRTAFDQFNLKYLIDKKKSFNMENESNIKGSNMPYFQSFTQRGSTRQVGNSKDNNTTPKQMDNFQSNDMNQSWAGSKKKRTSRILIDKRGVIHHQDQNSGNHQNSEQSNLKMSIKISNLKQMLKIEPLDYK